MAGAGPTFFCCLRMVLKAVLEIRTRSCFSSGCEKQVGSCLGSGGRKHVSVDWGTDDICFFCCISHSSSSLFLFLGIYWFGYALHMYHPATLIPLHSNLSPTARLPFHVLRIAAFVVVCAGLRAAVVDSDI